MAEYTDRLLGYHLLIDFVSTKSELNDSSFLDDYFTKLMEKVNVKILTKKVHEFHPQGITLFYLLAESHFSCHTWPEHQAISLDFYHCGNSCERLEYVKEKLVDLFGFDSMTSCKILKRGINSAEMRESLDDDIIINFQGYKILHKEKTQYQNILVIEHPILKRTLLLDNCVQICTGSKDLYSPIMINEVVQNQNNILIIGGGDCRILNLLMSYSIEKITIIEIDKRVVDISCKYFGTSDLSDNSKVQWIFSDASEYIRNLDSKFTGIIIDCTDPGCEISSSLYTLEFYTKLKTLLAPNAKICQQIANYDIENKELGNILKKVFDKIVINSVPIFEYFEPRSQFVTMC